MKNWFLALEDKLINFLTAICWWLDLHFDLKSERLSKIVFVFSLLTVDYYGQLNYDFGYLLVEIFISILYLFFFGSISILKNLYPSSKLNPNPNKTSIVKNIVFINFLFFLILYRNLSSMAYPFGFFFWYYILCTEPMPPAEKVKRKERNEMSKMKFSESS